MFTSRPLPACFISHDGWVKFSGLSQADEVSRKLRETTMFTVPPRERLPFSRASPLTMGRPLCPMCDVAAIALAASG